MKYLAKQALFLIVVIFLVLTACSPVPAQPSQPLFVPTVPATAVLPIPTNSKPSNNTPTPALPPTQPAMNMTIVALPSQTPILPSITLAPAPSQTQINSPTPAPAGQPVIINLNAQNVAFDLVTLTVSPGSNIVVNFNNKDTGVPHNFSVYQNLPGGQTRPVFIGSTIVGPKTIVYKLTAPDGIGSYFFECDVHPDVMNGAFIVSRN